VGDADVPRISFEENGPIIVNGLETFLNSRSEPIRVRKEIRLCRCGNSQNKPFCDSTHVIVGWTDERSDDRVPDQLDTYDAGDGFVVRDNRGICSHAGFCTDGCPHVWRTGVEPWVDPSGAPRDEIIETIRKCPSGALSYELDGVVHDAVERDPHIQVSRNGPYHLRGGIQIDGVERADGASLEHCTLCRCGHSKNKPFCDGSHWYAGFKDDEAITIAKANRAAAETEERWEPVGASSEFAVDEVKAVHVGETQIAVVRTADGVFALNGRCPHQGGPLTEGTICNGLLRCPWHGFDFKLDTGQSPGTDLVAETVKVRESAAGVEIAVPKPKRSTWTVSHVIVETLVNWGIDTVFGMVGHSNLGLAEAIRVQEERRTLRYFGIRHEGAASFAASGYAKVTGRPAACLSIAGPGATNLITGLWDARMDRTPILALTGQVNTQVMGPGAFQEIDLSSAFAAVARFSQVVLPGSKHGELASLAMKNAIVQRDVAHLIFPDEVQVLDAGNEGPGSPDGRLGDTAIEPPASAIANALYRIGRARRPVVIVGYGARDDMDDVIALAEVLGSPVITTFKAKGQISDHHALGAGVLGRSGTPVASWFMNEADLLIVFGASFSDHTGISTGKPVIQVDFDRMQLGKFHGVDEPVWGDIGVTTRLLRERAGPSGDRADQRAELADRWRLWREEKAGRATKDDGNGINSAIVFEHLSLVAPENAILPVDVGNNTYSFGRYFECKPGQSVVMSGYLGSIGFGFPAAMGAWAANTGRKVISTSGDGGFGQYVGEFTTAVKYGMDITHVLINNSELGKISKEQRDGEWKVWQTSLHNPNFAEYAALCGGVGIRVMHASELPSALREAMATDGPALVEVIADPMLT
jgi:thiamine pyrophosphate-dependent acetolactate synthase large subunit-like protein/CDGSH-type Zn-finger protein/nitrite reductase/ring-hydroxylating ferredoxin subunit